MSTNRRIQSLPIASSPDEHPLEKKNKYWRYARYAAIGLATNAALWGITLFYLKTTKPVYTSSWAVIVPG
ncbi:MAG: hypothetical protein ACK47G_09060, partial [Pseudanabaena sp.]